MCACCIVNDIMLQAQYVFVHDALCEVIQCGDTEILASRLSSTVENMAQNISGQTITGFQEQYSHTDPQYVPYLKPSQDEDLYINASFIDVKKTLIIMISLCTGSCVYRRGTSITELT